MAPRYAENTTVSSERSRAEVESLLRKYGAGKFGYMWESNAAVVVFEMRARRVRFLLPLPDKSDPKFFHTPTGRARRNPNASYEKWEQDCRSRWRALVLCIKAKLESVESGIETFEEAFLPHIVLPNGETIGEYVIPHIGEAYSARKMPPLLAVGK